MLNLDTHIVVHTLAGELTPKEHALLANDVWCVSDIVLWEIAMLESMKRINIGFGHSAVREFFRRVKVFPISEEVVIAMATLDFKSDSADLLIAATSVAHKIPLVTRDRKLRSSKKVPLA